MGTKKIKIIAEIAQGFEGNSTYSNLFVKAAASAGADAVKFQLFKIDKLFHKKILKKSKDHRDRKKWELPIDFISKISNYCKKKKIKFGCTPFYLDAVDELLPYVDFFKISSYELLYEELLKKCAKTKKNIIFSTGMANYAEVKKAYQIFKNNNVKKISILHCVSNYPAKLESCNLNSIKFLTDKLKCEVGWSDHTANPLIINEAIDKYNAKIIELHIDLDKKGYEYKFGHCWLPKDLSILFDFLKNKKKIPGYYGKKFSKQETLERNSRADPFDGLRPLKKMRNKL